MKRMYLKMSILLLCSVSITHKTYTQETVSNHEQLTHSADRLLAILDKCKDYLKDNSIEIPMALEELLNVQDGLVGLSIDQINVLIDTLSTVAQHTEDASLGELLKELTSTVTELETNVDTQAATRGGILKVIPSLLAGTVRIENTLLCTGTTELNPSAETVALRVNGESKFNGDVSISGRLLVGDNNALTTQVINDNIIINGNLDVSGITTLNTLNVNGDAVFGDNINMQNTNSTGTVGVINKNNIRFLHNAGLSNTFVGANAGNFSLSGGQNSGFGDRALTSITSGLNNSALGYLAMQSMTTGSFNTAMGTSALGANSTGERNTAFGRTALLNSTGSSNTALGEASLQSLTSGNTNIGVGRQSGINYSSSESNNIVIGNTGVASDSNTIRFGNGSHTSLFLMSTGAGATGLPGTGVATQNLQIDPATGAVTRFTSSARYKEDIKSMTDADIALLDKLTPATYYAKGTTAPRCYGLIAEEVAEVAKDLVIFNADNQPEAVRYEALIPMLVAAYRNLHTEHAALKARVDQLESR